MLDELIAAMEAAITEVKRWPDRRVRVFHHNDADGLSSGAILTAVFERAGFDVSRSCLEKPYPAVLERVFETKGRLIVLTDFAGRIAPLIARINGGRNLVFTVAENSGHSPNNLLGRLIPL